jgi:c-di-GMP-binding flagellar brake protein YcgR
MPSERRRAPRVAERVTITVRADGPPVEAETKNLSATGAYCLVDRFVPPMTKLDLRFELPQPSGHARVHCQGVVVRMEPVIASPEQGRYHMAIYFTTLSTRDRQAITRYVQQRLSSAPPTS